MHLVNPPTTLSIALTKTPPDESMGDECDGMSSELNRGGAGSEEDVVTSEVEWDRDEEEQE